MLRFGQNRASAGEEYDVDEYEYTYGNLNRFLNELGRMCGMSKLYHRVSRLEDGYVIAGRMGWRARFGGNGDVEIVIGNSRIRIVGQEIHLGDVAAEEICHGRCFSAHDIRVMMFTYITLWHWRIDDRDAIRRLAQMVRPLRADGTAASAR
jgi:hypothetical protein